MKLWRNKLNEKLHASVRQSYTRLSDKDHKIRTQWLNDAIFETEEYFELFDFDKFIQQLRSKNWRLDTLYIDKGTNRYKIE